MAPIRDLVKTYRLINDPAAPQWSIRFIGGFAVLGAVMIGAGAVLLFGGGDEGALTAAGGGAAASRDASTGPDATAEAPRDAPPAGNDTLVPTLPAAPALPVRG